MRANRDINSNLEVSAEEEAYGGSIFLMCCHDNGYNIYLSERDHCHFRPYSFYFLFELFAIDRIVYPWGREGRVSCLSLSISSTARMIHRTPSNLYCFIIVITAAMIPH